jgi:hypothetical protein
MNETYEAQTLGRITELVAFWLNNSKADDGAVLVKIAEEVGL